MNAIYTRKNGFSSKRVNFSTSSNAYLMLIVLFYYAAFSYNYINIISKDYSYMGFAYRGATIYEHLINIFFICCPIFFLPKKFVAPSDILFHLIYIIVYIPSVVIISFVAGGYSFDSVLFITNILLSFYFMFAISRLRIPRPHIGSMAEHSSLVALTIIAVVGVVILILQMGIASGLPDFRNVYGQRVIYMEAYAESPILPWIVGLTTQVTVPLILAYGFSKGNILYILFGIFVQIYIYSITGLKQSIISIVYILSLYLVLRHYRDRLLSIFVLGTIFFFAVGIFLDYAIDYDYFNGFFNRRTFMLQGLLTDIYYQFMAQREYFWWSHSVLSPFYKGSAVQSPEILIGRMYFFDYTHANASIWADGYMNGGILGLYIVCGITGLFLAILNSVSRQSDPKIVACGLAMLFMLVCQTGITKVVGTHGGLLAIFVLALTRFPGSNSKTSALNRQAKPMSIHRIVKGARLATRNG